MRLQKTFTRFETRIVAVRGSSVIVDSDLAELYHVETRHLNQAVRRNIHRFPADFAFQLTTEEMAVLRSQNVISNALRGGRRYRPWVFTEHGALMAATVLNSGNAIDMSVYIVRAFVRLRQLAGTHTVLAAKLAELEKRVTTHDSELAEIIRTLRVLLQPPPRAKRRIGYSGAV